MHKHLWKDVSYDYVWEYKPFECSSGGRWSSWKGSKRYQKEYPGVINLTGCFRHVEDHHQYPIAETIIHQRCECGNYREQYVDGILEVGDDVKRIEESKTDVRVKLKK